ncbi:MAG: type II toxin-antitoxin system RelE/ParE family toxin [Acidobacteriaceae bacterium]|jgi:putative addiction module killer protein
MAVVREYVDEAGYSPFRAWLGSLDGQAAIKVTVALERIADGHTSAMKALGEGISEYKIDFGPGYRIYFGKDSNRLVTLVGGGTKRRQQQDIVRAKAVWQDYKRRRE